MRSIKKKHRRKNTELLNIFLILHNHVESHEILGYRLIDISAGSNARL